MCSLRTSLQAQGPYSLTRSAQSHIPYKIFSWKFAKILFIYSMQFFLSPPPRINSTIIFLVKLILSSLGSYSLWQTQLMLPPVFCNKSAIVHMLSAEDGKKWNFSHSLCIKPARFCLWLKKTTWPYPNGMVSLKVNFFRWKNTYSYNSNVSVAHSPAEQDGYALGPHGIGESTVAGTSSINNTEMSYITVALLTSSLTIENLFWYLGMKWGRDSQAHLWSLHFVPGGPAKGVGRVRRGCLGWMGAGLSLVRMSWIKHWHH